MILAGHSEATNHSVDLVGKIDCADCDALNQRINDNLNGLIQPIVDEFLSARTKYEPLVKNLSDVDFAGLFKVVMEERTRRITQLIMTNPLVRDQAIRDLKNQIHDQEN